MTLNLKYFMYLSDFFPEEIRDIRTGKINNIFYFNTSLLKIKGRQLFIANYFNCKKKCIPGNDKKCSPELRNIGVKYPWNHWNSYRDGGGYIFLSGDYNKKTFTAVNRDIGRYGDPLNNSGDYRLFKDDKGRIYCYGTSFKNIYEISLDIDDNEITLFPPQGVEVLDKEHNKDPNLPYTNYDPGKNLSLVEYKIGADNHVHLLILDWFYSDGVYAYEKNGYLDEDLNSNQKFITDRKKLLTSNKKLIAYRKKLIPYNTNNGFDGKGSFVNSEKPEDIKKYGRNYGKLPMFSFGSNFIKIKGYKNVRISVAHSKIHSSEEKYPYNEKSNVHTFRKNIYKDMIDKYDDNYIKHYGAGEAPDCYGFIYLMYFILLLEKEDGTFEMKLGNSYLPLNLDKEHEDKYKFSLIFATGIQQENEDIIITAGEGDMYSILLKFSIDSIIADCVHDVKDMNMDNYIFKVIGYKNEKSIVGNRLSEVVSGFDGLKGGRRIYKLTM